MTITILIFICTATIIGFFAGLVIAAFTVKSNAKKDNDRYEEMMAHNRAVEWRLSRYCDHAERTADAVEAIASTLGSRDGK